MDPVSIFLGVNIYALFVGIFHKMLCNRHGFKKSFLISNLIIVSTLILVFLVYYR